MTDEFDKVFGSKPRPSFAERIGNGQASAPDPEDEKSQTVGSGPYKPYGFLPSGTIGQTCDVQRWIENTDVSEGIEFQYRFLMQIGYVGDEQLRLFLPDCIVVIEGRNLRDLRKKLARRQVTFIQQFSSKVWDISPPTSETLIETVEVLRPSSG